MLKPEWLKIRPPTTGKFSGIKQTLMKRGLVTVCEEAHCPNLSECWSSGTATFMILGDTCTRGCRFCNVKTFIRGKPVDEDEPRKIADSAREWGLDYIVITSVDRDDLGDQGASHFARCVKEVKNAGVIVEVLTPDFSGREDLVRTVAGAKPHVFGHNIETVRRLQRPVRDPRAGYDQSLAVLRIVKEMDPKIITKSSIMVGFGERDEEILEALRDLKSAGVSIVTFGQYLRPSARHLEIKQYVHPEKFEWFREQAEKIGLACFAGPFVRSSYRAGELYMKQILGKKR